MRIKPSASQVAAWRGLLTIQAKVVSRAEIALAESGLPPLSWYDVLFALHEQPDRRLRMAELAEAVLLSRSGLTRLVDKLEAAGCLRREIVEADKRGFNVSITQKGVELLQRMWPIYRVSIAEGFSDHLADNEITHLNKIFGKVLSATVPSAA